MDHIIKVYDILSQDPIILYHLGFLNSTGQWILNKNLLQFRVSKTRQSILIEGDYQRLAIWEDKGDYLNKKMNKHSLIVDVLVPLKKHEREGTALILMERVEKRLNRTKGIGTGLKYQITIPDLPVDHGWYKGSVRFNYNNIKE